MAHFKKNFNKEINPEAFLFYNIKWRFCLTVKISFQIHSIELSISGKHYKGPEKFFAYAPRDKARKHYIHSLQKKNLVLTSNKTTRQKLLTLVER